MPEGWERSAAAGMYRGEWGDRPHLVLLGSLGLS